jgi:predicted ATPase
VKVELRNIGPINRAELDLDGLAVLVGPNAAGKTTLSTAAYAVLISHREADRVASRTIERGMISRRAVVERDVLAAFVDTFRTVLERELTRCFSLDLGKLPRRGRTGNGSAPRIVVSHNPPGQSPWRLVFRIRDGGLVHDARHPDSRLPSFERQLEISMESQLTTTARRRRLTQLRRIVNPIYFPAARSGYVQMQTVISALLIAALGRGYFEQVAVGKISGVAADFLQFLAEIDPTEDSSLPSDAVERLEEELLRGHLRLSGSADTAKVIEFAPAGLEEYWPMDSAATSIAELAPLLLYLRHQATSRDLLFIDEPEAHLHPSNQLILADVLLQLSGLIRGMVVGTHSDFFAAGISNGLLRRRRDDPRAALDVSLYELIPASSTGGFVTEERMISVTAGFSIDQFSDVAEAALDEAEDLFEQLEESS